MKPPTEQHAAPEIIDLLADVFDCPPHTIRLRAAAAPLGYDYSISLAGHHFLVEYKSQATGGPLASALTRLKQAAVADPGGGLPILVVPYMGPLGKKLCNQLGVGWLDLSGNANIVAPGIRIRMEGCPNQFRERGRPSNVFAPKSSRVTRQLLVEPRRFQSQVEIAHQTELGDGYVSKIVRRLAQDEYLDANEAGAVRPRDPNLLFEAWHAAYDFNRHRIMQGQVPGGSGAELLRSVASQLSRSKINYAVTGLGAAWLYTGFTAFQVTTIYLRSSMPSRSLLEKIEFTDEPVRGNLRFVVPNDDGVFGCSQQQEGIPCAGAVQTLLDLKSEPEPANLAAVELSKKLLKWRHYGK